MPKTGSTIRKRTGTVAATVLTLALVATGAPAAQAAIPVVENIPLNGLDIRFGTHSSSSWTQGFPLKITTDGGDTGVAYCVDMHTGRGDDTPYTEGDWDASDIPNLAHAAWIAEHSAPNVPLAQLTDAVEAHSDITLADYDEYEAQGVTQFAIWSYTDDFEWDSVREVHKHTGNQGSFGGALDASDVERLRALFDYLTDPVINIGADPQPASSPVDFDESAAIRADGRYGPIVATTSGTDVPLVFDGPSGTAVVNDSGAPVTSVSDGDVVYIQIPFDQPAGSATLRADQSATSLNIGRLLFATDHQTLMVAKPVADASAAVVRVSWDGPSTPPPPTTPPTTPPADTPPVTPPADTPPASSSVTPPASTSSVEPPVDSQALATTGSDAPVLLGIAGLLFALGLAAAVAVRARRGATR